MNNPNHDEMASKHKAKEIKAIYIGEDGKFGLENGKEYRCLLFQNKAFIKVFFGEKYDRWAEYSSLTILLDNFSDIIPFNTLWIYLTNRSGIVRTEYFKNTEYKASNERKISV